MLKLSASAATDKERSTIKGTTNPPLETSKLLQRVAINDEPIRWKLVIL